MDIFRLILEKSKLIIVNDFIHDSVIIDFQYEMIFNLKLMNRIH